MRPPQNPKPNPDLQALARLKIIQRRSPAAARRLYLLLEIALALWRCHQALHTAAMRFALVAVLSWGMALKAAAGVQAPAGSFLALSLASTLIPLISSVLYILWPSRRVQGV